MTLPEARLLTLTLMRLHGLREKGWEFAFSTAKTIHGQCWYDRKIIKLSTHFALNNPEPTIRDTILHEIAHALVGPGHGHDHAWKQKCREIGHQAAPKSCKASVMPKGKHVAHCPTCRTEFRRHKAVKQGTTRYCVKCGPTNGRLTFRILETV